MKAEEIMIRSEIRQMLNEAGLNRDTLRGYVEEAVKEIVTKQVNQELDRIGGLDRLVNNAVHSRANATIDNEVRKVMADKLRGIKFDVHIDVNGIDDGEVD